MSSIQDFMKKIKDSKGDLWIMIIIITGVILYSIIVFFLGRLSITETSQLPEKGIEIQYPPMIEPYGQNTIKSSVMPQNSSETGEVGIGTVDTKESYVASKNGTKYYKIACSGVSRIKEENKVYFSSESEAEQAGYEKAANCF